MSAPFYAGQIDQTQILGDNNPRFFYGIRRNDDGDLFLVKIDQLAGTDAVQINNSGPDGGDFTDFSAGEDFFEGRDVYHNLVYPNLNYEQYRWDNRSIYYYIDAQGNLVQRVGQGYSYNTNDNV